MQTEYSFDPNALALAGSPTAAQEPQPIVSPKAAARITNRFTMVLSGSIGIVFFLVLLINYFPGDRAKIQRLESKVLEQQREIETLEAQRQQLTAAVQSQQKQVQSLASTNQSLRQEVNKAIATLSNINQ